jgi:hypothetical protein
MQQVNIQSRYLSKDISEAEWLRGRARSITAGNELKARTSYVRF